MSSINNDSITHEDLEKDLLTVFRACSSALSKKHRWNSNTTASYINIIAGLSQFARKPFGTLTFSEFDNGLTIQENGYLKATKKPYSASSKRKRRSILMQLTAYVASLHIGYRDPLRDSKWNPTRYRRFKMTSKKTRKQLERERQKKIDQCVKIPRSLTMAAENKIAHYFDDMIKRSSDGFCMAGLLFLYLGLRPGECCAVRYGDIKEIAAGCKCYALYVFKQKDSSGTERDTLKTTNAYRALPIPDELMSRIEARKDFVLSKLPFDVSIEECPIVNDTDGFSTTCKRKDLQKYIARVFEDAAVDGRSLSYPDAEMRSKPELMQSDPTLYIFRRNWATMLASVCAMNDDELQYLMGHEIENGRNRYEYIDPEILLRMHRKLNNRHLLDMRSYETVSLANARMEYEHINSISLIANEKDIEAADNHEILLDVYNDCPSDDIYVGIVQKRKTANVADCSDDDMENAACKDEPVVIVSCDYRKDLPETVGRISFVHDYCCAMISSYNKSISRKKHTDSDGK